jgi:acetylornithine deacetylase
MKTVEARVLDAIDIDGMIAYLCELVSIPSRGAEETPAQEHIAAKMREIGLAVDGWPLDFDALRRHPAFSYEIERTEGLGVVGVRRGGAGGRRLIFNGHIDVVPEGDPANWTTPPFQGVVRDGAVYGRGALDMKGGLCCALFAAKALRDAGVHLKGKLMVESVVGEEDGGTGALAAVLRAIRCGAVIPEPTALAGDPRTRRSVELPWTVRLLRPRLHAREGSARSRSSSSLSALLEYGAAHQGVDDPPLCGLFAPFPISVGTLQAGNRASTVPERLTFEGRYASRSS